MFGAITTIIGKKQAFEAPQSPDCFNGLGFVLVVLVDLPLLRIVVQDARHPRVRRLMSNINLWLSRVWCSALLSLVAGEPIHHPHP